MKQYLAVSFLMAFFLFGVGCLSQKSTAQKAEANSDPAASKVKVPPAKPLSPKTLADTDAWLTFRESGGRYEFKHPPNFKVEQQAAAIRVFHQVEFKHQSPCQPQLNESGQPDEANGKKLTRLTDFNVTFRLVDGGLKEAYLLENYSDKFASEIADWLTEQYKTVEVFDSEQRLNAENLKFYSGDTPTGCGSYNYAVPLAAEKTLLVKRAEITLLNVGTTYYMDAADRRRYAKRLASVRNLIDPAEEERIFRTILSTWRKLN